MKQDDLLALVAIALIIACSAVGIRLHAPPAALGADAPLDRFSAERAMRELEVVAARPHPIGTPANLGVRDYLLRRLTALGLEAEIQNATVVHGWRVADVENVVARLPGTTSTRSVLLAAHFDSVPTSYGAGDAGSAVATLLETARAVVAGGVLRNDVIFLFTNPEETFLHGARAFMAEHRWARDVGLVINMDPGGVSGPAYLHETSEQNGRLIDELASAVSHPVATSMAWGIKKLIRDRNDEFGVFAEAGVPGYNIAFIGGDTRYHTPLDRPDAVDLRSLQHLGSYALPLVRRYGNGSVEDRREPDRIYFNPVGPLFVHYPEAYALPMMVGVVVLLVVVLSLGLVTARLSVRGILLGLVTALAAVVLGPLVVLGTWWVLKNQLGVYDIFLTGNVYNGHLYLIGFVMLALGVGGAVYALVHRRAETESLAFGGCVVWAALSVASALYLPGGSYLFLWPLFFALLSLAYAFPREPDAAGAGLGKVVLLAGSVPGLLLVAPHVHPIFTALSMDEAPYLTALPVLVLALLVPALTYIMDVNRWLITVACLLAGAGSLVLALLGQGFDAQRPRPNFIVYGMDKANGSAVWATRSRAVELTEPDPWTRQFFTGETRRERLHVFPGSRSLFLQGDAPLADLPSPTAELVEETSGPSGRVLRLRVRSPRGAPIMTVVADRELPSWSLGEQAIDSRQLFAYWNVPEEGFELTVNAGDSRPLTLTVIDHSYGLPELDGFTIQPRPDNMMMEPAGGLIFSDATLVRDSFTF